MLQLSFKTICSVWVSATKTFASSPLWVIISVFVRMLLYTSQSSEVFKIGPIKAVWYIPALSSELKCVFNFSSHRLASRLKWRQLGSSAHFGHFPRAQCRAVFTKHFRISILNTKKGKKCICIYWLGFGGLRTWISVLITVFTGSQKNTSL